MAKREAAGGEGSGPPRQDELPPTASELDARVAALEDERLRELGLDPPPSAPPGAAPAAPARDFLDDLLS